MMTGTVNIHVKISMEAKTPKKKLNKKYDLYISTRQVSRSFLGHPKYSIWLNSR